MAQTSSKPRLTNRVRAGLAQLLLQIDRTAVTGDAARAVQWIDEMQAFVKKKGGILRPRGNRRMLTRRR